MRRTTLPQSILSLLLILLGNVARSNAEEGITIVSKRPVLTATEILRDSAGQADAKRSTPTSFTILGFVTPWNSGGVKTALEEAVRGRLDIVAPVTFKVLSPGVVTGGEDFDNAVYSSSAARPYPRFFFEDWNSGTLLALQPGSAELDAVVSRIAGAAETRGCGGVVVEVWHSLVSSGALHDDKNRALEFVVALGEGLQAAGVKTVLVLPPFHNVHQAQMTTADFERTSTAYDFYVVMTYDFAGMRGPIAPLNWCEQVARFYVDECSLGRKVLLGLNFYGLDFAHRNRTDTRHIVGHEFVSLVKEMESSVAWLDDFAEDAFGYESEAGVERAVFYPTFRSVQARVNLAQRVGCGGVAIWELGQGLPWLFDAL
jgi:chitinase domain-containing protein 1